MPPSARITDLVTCPIGGGGPIIAPCFPTVLIGGLPAARVTDQAVCAAGPDTIVRGAFTVLIGGLPAARITDNTAHAGLITTGLPTVLIGDPYVSFPVLINAIGADRVAVQTALGQLYSTPTGQAIIAGIAAANHTVTIQVGTSGSFCQPHSSDNRVPGKGTDSTVTWDPHQTLDGLDPANPHSSTVVLGHEMTHAYHNANGTDSNGPNDTFPGQAGSSGRGEERSTVGSAPPFDASGNRVNDAAGNPAGSFVQDPSGNYVPGTDYSKTSPTENSLRDDFGLPRRSTYYPKNWPGGAPW